MGEGWVRDGGGGMVEKRLWKKDGGGGMVEEGWERRDGGGRNNCVGRRTVGSQI